MNLCNSSLRRLLAPASRTAVLLGPIVFVLLAPSAAKAARTTWTAGSGNWNADGGASWSNGLPTTTGTAIINNGSTVSTPAAVTGNYLWLVTGNKAGEGGTINVNGGLLSGASTFLGNIAGGTGSATVTSGTWSNTTTLYVGFEGTGALDINGGTVTNGNTFIGYNTNSRARATVTSGTFSNNTSLVVAAYGTATLSINGGLVTNATGILGDSLGSNGGATVTSGTWNSTEGLRVGNSGTGTLEINGGLVRVSGTTVTGRIASGNGTITLSGNEERRGVLETGALAKGRDEATIGTGKVNFDGGIIRALADTNDFFLRYEAGDVTLNSGGVFLDTNGRAIGINAPLGGGGALNKIGLGTLTLGGSNAYTGGTVVEVGTLAASHQYALGTGDVTVKSGATFAIQSAGTVANSVFLEGGSLSQTVAGDTSLAGAIKASTTLGTKTGVQLLGGTTSAVTTLQASFEATSSAENDEIRLSSVLHLSGVRVINIGTGETDQFVLQLQVAGVTTETFLGWLDTQANEWVNAVAGNIGGTANFLGNKTYNAATDFQLGNYGVDTVNGTVWAVLNHNSQFAVIPEPGTWALLAFGAGVVLHHARKRREM